MGCFRLQNFYLKTAQRQHIAYRKGGINLESYVLQHIAKIVVLIVYFCSAPHWFDQMNQTHLAPDLTEQICLSVSEETKSGIKWNKMYVKSKE